MTPFIGFKTYTENLIVLDGKIREIFGHFQGGVFPNTPYTFKRYLDRLEHPVTKIIKSVCAFLSIYRSSKINEAISKQQSCLVSVY